MQNKARQTLKRQKANSLLQEDDSKKLNNFLQILKKQINTFNPPDLSREELRTLSHFLLKIPQIKDLFLEQQDPKKPQNQTEQILDFTRYLTPYLSLKQFKEKNQTIYHNKNLSDYALFQINNTNNTNNNNQNEDMESQKTNKQQQLLFILKGEVKCVEFQKIPNSNVCRSMKNLDEQYNNSNSNNHKSIGNMNQFYDDNGSNPSTPNLSRLRNWNLSSNNLVRLSSKNCFETVQNNDFLSCQAQTTRNLYGTRTKSLFQTKSSFCISPSNRISHFNVQNTREDTTPSDCQQQISQENSSSVKKFHSHSERKSFNHSNNYQNQNQIEPPSIKEFINLEAEQTQSDDDDQNSYPGHDEHYVFSDIYEKTVREQQNNNTDNNNVLKIDLQDNISNFNQPQGQQNTMILNNYHVIPINNSTNIYKLQVHEDEVEILELYFEDIQQAFQQQVQDMKFKLDCLSKIFPDVSFNNLKNVCYGFISQYIRKNDTIYEYGQDCQYVYILGSGSVNIYQKQSQDQKFYSLEDFNNRKSISSFNIQDKLKQSRINENKIVEIMGGEIFGYDEYLTFQNLRNSDKQQMLLEFKDKKILFKEFEKFQKNKLNLDISLPKGRIRKAIAQNNGIIFRCPLQEFFTTNYIQGYARLCGQILKKQVDFCQDRQSKIEIIEKQTKIQQKQQQFELENKHSIKEKFEKQQLSKQRKKKRNQILSSNQTSIRKPLFEDGYKLSMARQNFIKQEYKRLFPEDTKSPQNSQKTLEFLIKDSIKQEQSGQNNSQKSHISSSQQQLDNQGLNLHQINQNIVEILQKQKEQQDEQKQLDQQFININLTHSTMDNNITMNKGTNVNPASLALSPSFKIKTSPTKKQSFQNLEKTQSFLAECISQQQIVQDQFQELKYQQKSVCIQNDSYLFRKTGNEYMSYNSHRQLSKINIDTPQSNTNQNINSNNTINLQNLKLNYPKRSMPNLMGKSDISLKMIPLEKSKQYKNHSIFQNIDKNNSNKSQTYRKIINLNSMDINASISNDNSFEGKINIKSPNNINNITNNNNTSNNNNNSININFYSNVQSTRSIKNNSSMYNNSQILKRKDLLDQKLGIQQKEQQQNQNQKKSLFSPDNSLSKFQFRSSMFKNQKKSSFPQKNQQFPNKTQQNFTPKISDSPEKKDNHCQTIFNQKLNFLKPQPNNTLIKLQSQDQQQIIENQNKSYTPYSSRGYQKGSFYKSQHFFK